MKELGLSGGALMAFYCLGTVTACSPADDEPKPDPNVGGNGGSSNPPAGNTKVDFTLDLTSSTYSKLGTEGEYVYKDGVIVAFVSGRKYVALAKACTHAGTDVKYRLNQNDFWCDNHQSEFGLDGKVEKAPATDALTLYKTELNTAGDKLRVFE